MSISEWKEREKEQRRKDIVDAAEQLFFSRGYDNVSMDDIAKAVGLKKATLYLYFKNKEALFFAMVLRGFKILHAMVRENSAKATTGSEKLWEIGHAYLSFVKNYPDYTRACSYFYSGRFNLVHLSGSGETIGTMGYMASNYEFWKAIDVATAPITAEALEIIALNRDNFGLMRDAIRMGIEEGAFRKDVNPVEAAVVFTLLLESTPAMRPDLRYELESRGIDSTSFTLSIGNFMAHMLTGSAGRRDGQ